MSVPPKWEHTSTAQAGNHHAIGADPRAGRGLFPKPRALVLSMVKFGQAKPDGLGHIDTADSEWNPDPSRRNPTNIIAATCGRFHAVKNFKKPVITFLTSPITSLRSLATRTSPSCSTRTPLSQILRFSPPRKLRPAKIHGGMVLLIVRGLLRRPSFRYSDGHILLCSHPQCRGQET